MCKQINGHRFGQNIMNLFLKITETIARPIYCLVVNCLVKARTPPASLTHKMELLKARNKYIKTIFLRWALWQAQKYKIYHFYFE